jgi:nucleoid-associated protein YgaU
MGAPTQGTLTKARLTVQEPQASGNPTDLYTIEFPFNPKEWAITHAADWKFETTKKDLPPSEFKGTKPASVTVEIFLDESDVDGGDISKTVGKLEKLVHPEEGSVSKNKPSGPHVFFQWGTAITFKGYVDSVAVKYTMFRGNGTPIRGTCTLSMKEFPSPKGSQNPTSGGTAGRRTHRMVAGDTLASVAYAEYGDPTRWRTLADANAGVVDDPMRIPDGTVLHVPPE